MNIVEAFAAVESTELTIAALRTQNRYLLEIIAQQGNTIYALRAELAARDA